MIACAICEREIRGNAAQENYNERTGAMEYTCKRCLKVFDRAIRKLEKLV